MKRKLFVLFLTFILSACGAPWSQTTQPSPSSLLQFSDRHKITVDLAAQELELEIVSSPSSITQGLSDRPTMGSDGMLFVLPSTTVPQFWMKDMQFDLDLVWLRDNQVIQVTANVPHPSPGTNLQELPVYSPAQPVDMVLELEAGKAAQWGISPGARLQVK